LTASTVEALSQANISKPWLRIDISDYVLNATILGDSGALLDAVVSNNAGSVTSSAAVDGHCSDTATADRHPACRLVGGAVAFTVVATGTAPLHYEWKRNDVVVPNQNESKLLVAPVTTAAGANATGFPSAFLRVPPMQCRSTREQERVQLVQPEASAVLTSPTPATTAARYAEVL